MATSVVAEEKIRQLSTHMGEMYAEIEAPSEPGQPKDSLRFEPWQMIDEMFVRDDLVFLMRHGPTDWSKLDIKDVAPTDCANQRVMSPQGKRDVENLGILMASNDLKPARIVVSEWCRNQQTVEYLKKGFGAVDAAYADGLEVETEPALNLLLSLQGAPNVSGMRDLVQNWEGSGGNGPLLMISHYTNIDELTDFRVYEGEILVVDPKREGRVLGYLRLRSASPDVGHFDTDYLEQ